MKETLKLAWRQRGLTVRTIADVTRLMTMSIADLLDDWFESTQLKGALAVNGVIGTYNEVAPNFKSAILHRDVVGPYDMEHDYGIPAVSARSAATREEALEAAPAIGYPVALKTDMPGISHESDVDGVRLGVADPAELAAAYADFSARLGPRVTVTDMAAPGQELILGMARDPALGPLIVVGAGGVLAEHLAERAVALPPLTSQAASALLDGLRFSEILKGVRGQPPCDRGAIIRAMVGFSSLIADLGEHLDAFDINPLICSPAGVMAVDALAIPAR